MSVSSWEGPDESKRRALPSHLGAALQALESQAFYLLDEWIIYRQLYGTDQERIDLFNETARHFFGVLQYTLRDSVILQICRIATDKPKIGGKDTLVLRHLVELVNAFDPALGTQLATEWNKLSALCSPMLEWRNNRVAHLNRDAHLDASNNPPTDFSRKQVQEAIDSITAFLNLVRLQLTDGEFCYDAVRRYESAEPLILRLIQSYVYFDLEQKDPATYDNLLRTCKYGRLYAGIQGSERSA